MINSEFTFYQYQISIMLIKMGKGIYFLNRSKIALIAKLIDRKAPREKSYLH